jgi:hypothetical protein
LSANSPRRAPCDRPRRAPRTRKRDVRLQDAEHDQGERLDPSARRLSTPAHPKESGRPCARCSKYTGRRCVPPSCRGRAGGKPPGNRACRRNHRESRHRTLQGEYRAMRARNRLHEAVHGLRGAKRFPSSSKAGAAEVVHSQKKASGEVNETPQWRRSKGDPVWGAAASPSVAPADKSGGTSPPAPTPLSITEPAKVRNSSHPEHDCNRGSSLHAARRSRPPRVLIPTRPFAGATGQPSSGEGWAGARMGRRGVPAATDHSGSPGGRCAHVRGERVGGRDGRRPHPGARLHAGP